MQLSCIQLFLPLRLAHTHTPMKLKFGNCLIGHLSVCTVQGMQLKRHIDATLGSGNLREAVRLPIGEDLNEWLAVNSNLVSVQCLLVSRC